MEERRISDEFAPFGSRSNEMMDNLEILASKYEAECRRMEVPVRPRILSAIRMAIPMPGIRHEVGMWQQRLRRTQWGATLNFSWQGPALTDVDAVAIANALVRAGPTVLRDVVGYDFEGNRFGDAAVARLIFAIVRVGNGLAEVDLSSSSKLRNLDLRLAVSPGVEDVHGFVYGPPSKQGISVLRLNACPIQRLAVDGLAPLQGIQELSLCGTELRNPWSVLGALKPLGLVNLSFAGPFRTGRSSLPILTDEGSEFRFDADFRRRFSSRNRFRRDFDSDTDDSFGVDDDDDDDDDDNNNEDPAGQEDEDNENGDEEEEEEEDDEENDDDNDDVDVDHEFNGDIDWFDGNSDETAEFNVPAGEMEPFPRGAISEIFPHARSNAEIEEQTAPDGTQLMNPSGTRETLFINGGTMISSGDRTGLLRMVRKTPMCSMRYYAEFFVSQMPKSLKTFDSKPVTAEWRAHSRKAVMRTYEIAPYGLLQVEPVLALLRARERGRLVSNHPCARKCFEETSKEQKERVAVPRETLYHQRCLFRRSISSSLAVGERKPDVSILCPARYRPRQFEYHPKISDHVVIGTLGGEVLVMNHASGRTIANGRTSRMREDTRRSSIKPVFGLCWLNLEQAKFVAGLESGGIQLFDVNRLAASGHSSSNFDSFDRLTSLHVNCDDTRLVVSGYSKDIGLLDMGTGRLLSLLRKCHKEHINVVRFKNYSPFIFVTSSFDQRIRMWDTRTPSVGGVCKPIYSRKSDTGNVMVCFSPDDRYLLVSGVDNDVRQLLSSDGRQVMKLDLEPRRSHQNFTRSYYMNGYDYILTGSSEERGVRVLSSRTGKLFREIEFNEIADECTVLDDGDGPPSLFVQSLRGDPFHDFNMCVLLTCPDAAAPCAVAKVNMLKDHWTSSSMEWM